MTSSKKPMSRAVRWIKEVDRLTLEALVALVDVDDAAEWDTWPDGALNCVAVEEPRSAG